MKTISAASPSLRGFTAGERNISQLFAWQEYDLDATVKSTIATSAPPVPVQPLGGYASHLVNQTVYISMTSTSFRLHSVHNVIEALFAGKVWPDRLYLFLSSSPFLLDKGVLPGDVPESLIALTRRFPLSIVFTGWHVCWHMVACT
jgi:hypothetical protein